MSEHSEHQHEDPQLLAVRVEQNRIEDNLLEAFLAKNLFHDHLHPGRYDEIYDYYALLVVRSSLREEFVKDQQGLNMGERFALALSAKYFDKIKVAELGLSREPSRNGEVDGLKHEYRDLRYWFQLNGLIETDLPREESGRSIELRKSIEVPDRVVLIRNRPLIYSEIDTPQGRASFGIAKRMVFSVPEEFYCALAKQSKNHQLDDEYSMQCVENALTMFPDSIHSIRTGYYLVTTKL